MLFYCGNNSSPHWDRNVSIENKRINPESTFEVNENVFYNRLEKCGSRSLLSVARRLAHRNNFTFSASSDYRHKRPRRPRVLEEIQKISNFTHPTFYNRHIHYINFGKFGYSKPIYVNLIRDPIERFISHYNYMKYGEKARDVKTNPSKIWELDINVCVTKNIGVCGNINLLFYTGLYFCGLDEICLKPSRASVELAKMHIDKDYAVIGITEEFENTLKLFEKVLPNYFSGALEVWKDHSETKMNTASYRFDVLSQKSKYKLRYHDMAAEYEVYNHAKRKFEYQKKQYDISN
ncbi:uronyl 2-sulfotransferase-like [Styela clava]